jgi:lipopolysaccharide/colanic/teichoic acid biosynthesis glycosyltransferase
MATRPGGVRRSALFDRFYVRHQCFFLDLRILWWTLFAVFKRRGV